VHHYPVKPLGKDYGLDPNSPFPAFIDTGVALIDKTNVQSLLTKPSSSQ
jgi:ribose transport system substrate-binding protein